MVVGSVKNMMRYQKPFILTWYTVPKMKWISRGFHFGLAAYSRQQPTWRPSFLQVRVGIPISSTVKLEHRGSAMENELFSFQLYRDVKKLNVTPYLRFVISKIDDIAVMR